MNRIYHLAFTLLFVLILKNLSVAQCEDWAWAKNVGINVYYQSNGITTDDSGNVIYVGFYYGSFGGTVGGGSGNNVYIVKYDKNGNVIWIRTSTNAGTNSFSYRNQVGTDAQGNIIIAGCFIGSLAFGKYNLVSNGGYDIYVVKFAPNGEVLWAMKAGGASYDIAYDLHVFPDSRFALAGYFVSPVLAFGSKVLINSSSSYDMFVVMFRSNGSAVWAEKSQGSMMEAIVDLCGDDDGNVYVVGYYYGAGVKFGYLTLPSAQAYQAVIIKINRYGVPYWAEIFAGNTLFYGHSLTIDISGNVYLTGLFLNSITFSNKTITSSIAGYDIYIFKMDKNRNVYWGKSVSISGVYNYWGASTIATDLAGGLFIMLNFYNNGFNFGTSKIVNKGSYDVAILKYDSSGNAIRAKSIGGSSMEIAGTITSDRQGNIIVQGGFRSPTLKIGNNTLYKLGTTFTFNPFIAKLQNSVITELKKTDITCFGDNNGKVDLKITGTGSPPYTTNWSTGEATEDLVNQGVGSKIVTVTDGAGCVVYDSVVINEPAPLKSSYVVTDNLCNGGNSGMIDLTVTGGTFWYHYLWSTGMPFQDLKDLSAGTYTVYISDRNKCALYDTLIVSESSLITLNQVIRDLKCNGDISGSINLNVLGGNSPYSYSWSTGDSNKFLIGLNGGDYIVSVTDMYNCEIIDTFNVFEPKELTLSQSVFDLKCFSENIGSIDLHVSGGTAPFTFNWSTGATSEDIDNLGGGSYTVIVDDKNGCNAEDSIFVFEPTKLFTNIVLVPMICYGENNAAINLNVGGGTKPYYYNWTNGATTGLINNLGKGLYKCVISDSNNCIMQDSVNIIQPDPLILTSQIDDVSCFGFGDGKIDLTIVGGYTPYNYEWSNNEKSQDLKDIGPGTYSVKIVDSNNCVIEDSMTITGPPDINLKFTGIDIKCNGDSDGSIDLSVSGGTSPFKYNWSNGETTQDIYNVVAGDYIVTVTEANGCTTLDSFSLNEPKALNFTYIKIDETCKGDHDGSIDITITGGAPPFKYLWSHGYNTEDLNDITFGNYSVKITDQENCTFVSDTIFVDAYSRPELEIFPPDDMTICKGNIVLFSIKGVTDPVNWSTGENAVEIIVSKHGNYFAYTTDSNGCEGYSDTVVIKTIQSPIEKSDYKDFYYYCSDSGNILMDAGYFKDAKYLWSPSLDTSQTIDIDKQGTYSIKITIDKCIAEDTFEVVELCKPIVYAPNAFTPNGDGLNDSFVIYTSYVEELIFIVFDRWGKIVYKGTDVNSKWDGKFNGDYLEEGVYYYYLNYSNRPYGEGAISGNVMILR